MQQPAELFSFENLRKLRRELDGGTRSPAEICARYVLLHLHARHPAQWLSSPRAVPGSLCRSGASAKGTGYLTDLGISLSKRQGERIAEAADVRDVFTRFYFRGVVLDSHEGIVGWLEQRYPLHLRLDIPSPDEMLEAQCEGRRFVTLMLDENIQFQAHGRHRDACAFLLHDFEHAHKFFGNPLSFVGQRRFFTKLKATSAVFDRWMDDAVFAKDFDYLKSDMNSHPVHLTKYLKAVVLSAEMRRTGKRHPELDGFWRSLFQEWGLNGETLDSALQVNQPESEKPEDLVNVAGFFMPVGETPCGPPAMEAR